MRPELRVVRLLTRPKKQPASREASGQSALGSGSSVPSSPCEEAERPWHTPPTRGRMTATKGMPRETPGRRHPRTAALHAIWGCHRDGVTHPHPGDDTGTPGSGQAAPVRPPSPALWRALTWVTAAAAPHDTAEAAAAPAAVITTAGAAGSLGAPSHWPHSNPRRGAHWPAGGSGGESGVRRDGTELRIPRTHWLKGWSEDSETSARGQ